MSDFDDRSVKQALTGDESSLAEEAIAWFTRLRSDRCSAEARRAFESWRSQSPAHAIAFEEACALWNDPALGSAAALRAQSSGVIYGRERASSGSFRWLTRLAAAAAVAGVLVTAGLQLDIPLRLTSDYNTSTGERQVVQLSDRSTVTLNARSAISTEFDVASRRVHLLKGEALFQVAHDTEKAFVVDSRHITTRAVGTEFLVREELEGIRVTVIEGIVELAPAQPGWAPIRLSVGKQVSVGANGPGLVRDIDVASASAWLRGRLVVNDARLGDVLEELRRYYPGTIQIWDSSVNDIRVSGSYNLTDPARVFTTLAETLPIRMARITDRVVILF
ncbi:MAG: FecR family protein [Nitrospirota bacterium]